MLSGDRQYTADILLLIVTLLAAAGWIFSKEALAGMPPLLFIGTRFLLAGAVLALVGWRALCALSGEQWRRGAMVGVLFALAMALWIMGLRHTSHVGEGAFITSLGTVLVPVVGRFVFGDRPPLVTWIALPIAVCGFGLLSLDRGFNVEPGQWFFLASAGTFAFLFNLNSRLSARVAPVALTAIQLLVVGVLCLLVSAPLETWPPALPGSILGWLLASALIATTLRFFAQLSAQSMTTPSHAAVIMMLEPVWTALVAAAWFRESMSLLQFTGCGLIFLALLVNRWSWVRRLLKSAFVR